MIFVTGARAEEPASDVTVRGPSREPGSTRLSGNEVREVPGAFGDPARAIEAVPGVVRLAAALPFFFVRGATPANTGYFVDGMHVPLLSHGPPGGGVVPDSVVESVDFYPGAAPARFGSVAGGVLSLTTRPPSERTRGEANVRLYDASALAETPIAGGRGSFLAAGRYGYTELLLRLIEPSARQSYWDYHARATWDASRNERVSAVVLGARDFVGSGESGTLLDSEFHRAEVRYDVSSRGGGDVRVAATAGANVQGNDVGSVTDRILGVRVESTHPVTDTLRLGAGASVTSERYDVDVKSARAGNPEILFAPRNDLASNAYAELAWRVSEDVEIDPGLRVGMFATKRDEYPRGYFLASARYGILPPPGAAARFTVDPRLATRVRLTSRAAFLSTLGLAHAPPSFLLPGLAMSRLEDGLQTAAQTSGGVELTLPADLTAKVTGFLHDYLDLSDPTSTCPSVQSSLFEPTDPCFARRVRGRAFGGEFLVRRSLTKRATGWISYTLSRSTRESHALGWSILGASREAVEDVLSEWDRTHVLTAIGAYDLGRGWRAGARFSYSTGRPYSHTIHGVLVPPFNRDRLPAVYRIDLRLEKRWTFSDDRRISLVLEGFNVTAAREVIECRPDYPLVTAPVPPARVRGPIDRCKFVRGAAYAIPSIGIEGAF